MGDSSTVSSDVFVGRGVPGVMKMNRRNHADSDRKYNAIGRRLNGTIGLFKSSMIIVGLIVLGHYMQSGLAGTLQNGGLVFAAGSVVLLLNATVRLNWRGRRALPLAAYIIGQLVFGSAGLLPIG